MGKNTGSLSVAALECGVSATAKRVFCFSDTGPTPGPQWKERGAGTSMGGGGAAGTAMGGGAGTAPWIRHWLPSTSEVSKMSYTSS